MTNTGHGHVRPRPDGIKMRCGGPGLCSACSKERASSILWDTDPQALAAIPPDEVPIAPMGSDVRLEPCCGRYDSVARTAQCENCPRMVAAPDVWMQALGGTAVDLVNPTPDMIHWPTIATVLARLPRFGGHTRNGTYSVAQHCIEGAAAIVRDGHPLLAAAAFLIHDAHEAYIGDVTTPVQRALAHHADQAFPYAYHGAVERAFTSLKSALDSAIYPAAGLPWPLPPHIAAVVKSYDIRMMVTERDERLDPPPYPWRMDAERVTGCDLYHWSEGTVAALYAGALRTYGIGVDSSRLEPDPFWTCGND